MAKTNDGTGFKEVLADLKKGDIKSLYVFEGEEVYLKNKLLKAIEKLLIEPSTKTLDYVSYDYSNQASKVNLQQIIADIKTPAFLSKRRLVVIKNSGLFTSGSKSKKEPAQESAQEENDTITPENDNGSVKDKQTMMSNLFDMCTESCTLVFVEDKVDKRLKSLSEKINKIGTLANISKPDIRETRQWVKSEFLKSDIKISPDDCDYFIDKHDANLQSMVFEIEKIILFVQSKKKDIADKTDIDEIGSSDLKGSIFDIVDALSKNNAGEAYRLLDLLIIQKQPIPLITFMLSRHIRQLITAKDLNSTDLIIKRMKTIPFVANKLFYQAKNFKVEALEALYKECFEMDMAVKTSKIQDRLALETLFASTVHKIH